MISVIHKKRETSSPLCVALPLSTVTIFFIKIHDEKKKLPRLWIPPNNYVSFACSSLRSGDLINWKSYFYLNSWDTRAQTAQANINPIEVRLNVSFSSSDFELNEIVSRTIWIMICVHTHTEPHAWHMVSMKLFVAWLHCKITAVQSFSAPSPVRTIRTYAVAIWIRTYFFKKKWEIKFIILMLMLMLMLNIKNRKSVMRKALLICT